MNENDIKTLWAEVMPRSMCTVSRGALDGLGLYCRIMLAGSRDECTNGILENDMLDFRFCISAAGNYEEYHGGPRVMVRPAVGSFMAFDTVKLRAKNIKNVTPDKLRARFLQIRQLIADNAANIPGIDAAAKVRSNGS